MSNVPDHDLGIPKGSLLDVPWARRIFDRIEAALAADVYVYQIPWTRPVGTTVRIEGKTCLNLSSYSYLGLIGHPRLEEAAARAMKEYGSNSGGVRFLSGTTRLHVDFEASLARLTGQEAVITYGSGYLANISCIASLFGEDDLIVLDKLDHRSIYEGARLTGATVVRFRHNDVAALDRVLTENARFPRKLVCLEGIYSMAGDLPPLAAMVDTARRHNAFILLDEAHSLGVLGPEGGGILSHLDLPADSVDMVTGSLSKAIPGSGGFVAGSRKLVTYLQHGSSAYCFSAALAPPVVACGIEALAILEQEPDRLTRLRHNTKRLREGLRAAGFSIPESESAIIPVLIGKDADAFACTRFLLDLDVYGAPVITPAVAPGKSILRICGNTEYTDDHITEAIEKLTRAGRHVGVLS